MKPNLQIHGLISLLKLPFNMQQDVGGQLLGDFLEHTNGKVKEWIHSVDGRMVVDSDQCEDILGDPTSSFESPSGTIVESVIPINLQEGDHVLKSAEMVMQFNPDVEKGVLPAISEGQNSSTFQTSIKVKEEPCGGSESHNLKVDGQCNFSFNFMNIKSEQCDDDLVEHICLRDRLKFVMSGEDLCSDSSTSYTSLKDTRPSTLKRSSSFESPESLSIKFPRKRKKTAT